MFDLTPVQIESPHTEPKIVLDSVLVLFPDEVNRLVEEPRELRAVPPELLLKVFKSAGIPVI